ncbi:hypothetical protein ACFPMF_01665 [Larkinella bovis]|uniref:Uncharacterized protein n=1 Tax=Larkinella bovis TaxID=683041 RepID=A0ABW0I3X2_9BACT
MLDLISYIRQALPPSSRTPLKIALTRMLFTPILTVWAYLDALQESFLPRATASGQTAILRHLLNQAIGLSNEIYIVDGNFSTVDFQVVIPDGSTPDLATTGKLIEVLERHHLTSKRYKIVAASEVSWKVDITIVETTNRPDWFYGLGIGRTSNHQSSLYFHVKDQIKWWIERPTNPQPTGGDDWEAKTWAMALPETYTDPWNYVARLNPEELGVDGILSGVSYTVKVCRRANEAEVYRIENVVFPESTGGITAIDLRNAPAVVETNVKPAHLVGLAFSRLELTHEHSAYVNSPERPYYRITKLNDPTAPTGGNGWKPNAFYAAKSNPYNPPYGWVIRLNPGVLGTAGILKDTAYQLALWWPSHPTSVFTYNFTPTGDAGITPVNFDPVIPDPGPGPDPDPDPGSGGESEEGDGPGMGGAVETTIMASNRNVMNLAVSWVTVEGVQRAKITDSATYSTPGGQKRGVHIDGGDWYIDDNSWQNLTYPPRTRVSVICVVSPNPKDSYTTITALAQAHISIGDAP